MEIKTEKNEIMSLDFFQEKDPLKGTEWDDVFGSKSPLRVEGITLNDWIEKDPDLNIWLEKKEIPVFEEKDWKNLENYFSGSDHKIKEKILEKIIFFDILEKKYDIPEIAKALRCFNIHITNVYLIEGGNEKFISNIPLFNRETIKKTIQLGSIKYLEFLKNFSTKENHGRYMCESYCAWAAEKGHLHILKWLRDPNTGGGVCDWDEDCCAYAAQGGHLNVLKWLRDPNTGGGVCPWNEYCCAWAASNGHLHILKWLRDPNTGGGVCPWNEWCCNYAAQNDHLHILKWLRDPETGGGVCPWDGRCCASAASNGHLHILKWLRDPETGGGVCPWNEWCCASAVINGHLHILKWLRDPETGGGVCDWDENCCAYAARNGHLNILKWLRDPNTGEGVCPWNERVCYHCAKSHHNDITEWIMRHVDSYE